MKRRRLLVLIGFIVIVGIIGTYIMLNKNQKQVNPEQVSSTQNQSDTQASAQDVVGFNKQKYSLDQPDSIWIVVNKQRPLNPNSYVPSDLVLVGNGQFMRTEAAKAYSSMVTDAGKSNYSLFAESGYRSFATQTSVYANEVRNYGQATADTESARPGYSEHQTGWAVDIGTPGCIEDCFGTTPAAKWVLTNAASYGFIQRYPNNKSDITGYRNEPWHFRYVGTELAQEMARTGQTTLEEFFGLPAAPSY